MKHEKDQKELVEPDQHDDSSSWMRKLAGSMTALAVSNKEIAIVRTTTQGASRMGGRLQLEWNEQRRGKLRRAKYDQIKK